MGVEIFKTAMEYRNWVSVQSNKKVVSVVVFDGDLVVTWEFV
jgi:hypothetical protein